jgi:hypothetical protein
VGRSHGSLTVSSLFLEHLKSTVFLWQVLFQLQEQLVDVDDDQEQLGAAVLGAEIDLVQNRNELQMEWIRLGTRQADGASLSNNVVSCFTNLLLQSCAERLGKSLTHLFLTPAPSALRLASKTCINPSALKRGIGTDGHLWKIP